MERRRDADQDGFFAWVVRGARHPLRAFVMCAAVFAMVSDVALSAGIVAAVIGALIGVIAGEILGSTRIRLSWILAGFSSLVALALAFGAAMVRIESWVEAFGTGGALRLSGVLRFGALALFATGMMRATAKRRPGWLALELAFVVVGVATAFAAHRHGVIARPLWLSDFAWRRGLDPADLLIAIGVATALASISLLVFERKGRLSFAALPLLPLIAMLGISCLQVTREGAGRSDASPDELEANGDAPHDTEEEGERGGGQGNADGGARDGGPARQDGGSRSRDAGVRDGGGGSGRDGGARDGGRGAGGHDGGSSGGGGADGGVVDAGSGWSGWDAGLDDTELPPPQMNGEGEGGTGSPSSADDILDRPPPTGEASAAPAAIVLFESDYSPPSETYYFRQDAWSHFNGTRLVPTSMPEADRDIAHRFPAGRLEVRPPSEAGRAPVMATVAFLIEHSQPFALESPVYFEDTRNPNPSRFRRAYRFLSRAQSIPYRELFGRTAGDPAWSPTQRELYLQPPPDPRFTEFAVETVNTLPRSRRDDPFARALAIKLRLDELLTYSTRERHADAEDPTVDFFFGNRIGYCVHFAHAAVYLWRAVGIPARIGVGYASPEANRRGGSALLVRTGDAHAWPELYLDGVGWVVLDIAAARNLDPPHPGQDEDLQRLLGEMAREEPPEPADEVRRERRHTPSAAQVGRSIGVLFLIALSALLAALYLLKLWRRMAPRFAGAPSIARVSYRAALDRLAELGMTREHGETREQYAKRASALSPAFAQATALALLARLGAPERSAEARDAARWREVRRAIRRELGASTPWWRRLIGLLNPLSFLDAR